MISARTQTSAWMLIFFRLGGSKFGLFDCERAALIEAKFGIDAEGRSLEDIADSLSGQ